MAPANGDFVAETLAPVLAHNGLTRFEDLWGLDHRWVQPPNERRGGWSAVARHGLPSPAGGMVVLYIKVHRGRVSRSLRRPLGEPTLRREFRTLRRLARLGIPVTPPLYFAERTVDGEARALLATEELGGHESLKDLGRRWARDGFPPPSRRRPIIEGLARITALGHDHRFKFNALTAEHTFVRWEGDSARIRLLDLERCKRVLWRPYARVGDLATLERTSHRMPLTDRIRFLRAYLQSGPGDARLRRLWRAVERRRRQEGSRTFRGKRAEREAAGA